MQEVNLVGVSKYFGETVVVKDFNLEINRGEFVFLLGPSGAGKTTVLRMIGGYEIPSSGTISIGGQDITRLPVHKRNIGMVFQGYALFPHMTVAQNVAFGLKMRHLPKAEVAEKVSNALEMVELTGLDRRFPGQLSGGQQQRVALARAVVYQPGLLLLDEPLANLDRRLRDTMRVELKRLQRRIGITAIMVTHDQEESLSMADRIVLMHKGQLEQEGTPQAIYGRPATPFTAAFMGEMNLLRGEVLKLENDRGLARIGGLEFKVPVENNTRAGNEVTFCLRAERIKMLPENIIGKEETSNSIPGQVEFVTYLGAATLYLVRPQNGQILIKVLEPNPSGKTHYLVGDKVTLEWPIDSAFCFYGESPD